MKLELDDREVLAPVMDSIGKGATVLDAIASRLAENPKREVTVTLDELLAIGEGYKAATECIVDIVNFISDATDKASEKVEEEKNVLAFIDEHREAFQSLMRRCGIW